MKKVFLVIVFLIVVSCKGDKKQERTPKEKENIEVKKDNLKNKLRIYIDGIVKNDIQPKMIFSDEFATEKIVSNQIKGLPQKKQRLSFVFPELTIPDSFMIIFDNDCEINLERIVLNINNDRIIIKDSAFFEYFSYPKSLKINKNTLIISKSDTLKSSKSLNERIFNRYSKYQ